MTPDPNILKKIRALATMADPTRGGSPQEVETAAKHMQKLMDQYNISLLEVMNTAEGKTAETFGSMTCEGLLGAVKQWHWALAHVIGRIMSTKPWAIGGYGTTARAKMLGVKGIGTRGHRMSFFGAKQGCEASCELFDLWLVELDRMAVNATSEYVKAMQRDPGWQELMAEQGVSQFRHLKGLGSAHPTVWRGSWLNGLISGINKALGESEVERKQLGTPAQASLTDLWRGDPIVPLNNVQTGITLFKREVETAYQAFHKQQGIRTVSASSTRANWDAHSRGKAVGKQIKLTSRRLK